MLNIKQIKNLFHQLNDELKKEDVVGEVGICGGAVMCLVFQSRKATKDVDAIFEPTSEIRQAVLKVAQKNGIEKDWLNDAVKGFFHKNPPREDVMNLSHLRVWAPTAEYMLAMKAISARFDTHDKDDVIFLIKYLELKTLEDVFKVISKFYPKHQVPAKSQFLIEEIFEKE